MGAGDNSGNTITTTDTISNSTNSTAAINTCALPDWYVYVAISAGFFLTGFLLTAAFYSVWWLLQKLGVRSESAQAGAGGWMLRPEHLGKSSIQITEEEMARLLRRSGRFGFDRATAAIWKRLQIWVEMALTYSERLESGSSFGGKLYNMVVFVVSIASWILYIMSSYLSTWTLSSAGIMEVCGRPWILWLDLFLNMVLFASFLVRFVASRKKLLFFFTPSSITDYLTIPQSLLAIVVGGDWAGLRFARAIRLLNIPDILVYLHVLRGYAAIRITKIACTLLTLIFTSAGLISLIESIGDFWVPADSRTRQQWSYLDSVYFMIVTIVSVGYGDYTPRTVLGKLYMCIFLVLAVAYFASIIPELSRLLGGRKLSLPSSYEKHMRERHVIICGSLNYRNVRCGSTCTVHIHLFIFAWN